MGEAEHGGLMRDPQQEPHAAAVARRDLRVSDAERHAVIDELRVHFSLGRIDLAELEERVSAALASTVRGDLEPLLDDLPEVHPARPSGPPVRERPSKPGSPLRVHAYLWAVLSVFFVVIWTGAAMGGSGGTFWPIFPIAGVGLTVGVHAAIRKGLGD